MQLPTRWRAVWGRQPFLAVARAVALEVWHLAEVGVPAGVPALVVPVDSLPVGAVAVAVVVPAAAAVPAAGGALDSTSAT